MEMANEWSGWLFFGGSVIFLFILDHTGSLSLGVRHKMTPLCLLSGSNILRGDG